jgi:fructan beta-fructosidase
MTIDKKYLVIPICNGAGKCNLELEVAGKKVLRCGAELAPDANSVDFWAYFTIESYKGRPAAVSVSEAPARGLAMIRQSDEIPGQDKFYTESLRPQLRFSQKVGWNNDTNGMVYHDGEWHLFFQYCPVALRHADKFWGHAVSRDLIHWEELPIALYPFTQAKGQCFSGSAVVDHNNTAGFQTGDKPPIVAVFSDFGSAVGEALAYSNDRGRTFTYYQGNPVLKHPGNDPKVIWYKYGKNDQPINDEAKKLGGHWVMAVYDGKREYGKNIAFYTSTDLKDWTERSHLPGYAECPEILELTVDPSASGDSAGTGGDTRNTRWVVFAADAQYAVGQFDGKVFTPEHEGKHRVHYGAYFASQTFNNPPDGRTIQIGWARINMPGMPFNQAFTLPHRLTLRKTADGIRMFAAPIREIASLRTKTHSAVAGDLAPDSPRSVAVCGELFEIRAEFALGQAQAVGLDIGGNRVAYDVAAKKLNGTPMAPVDGKVSMQVIVDRPMIEICGNGGAVYITSGRGKRGDVSAVRAFANGGQANLIALEVHELKSIWKK